MRIPELSVFESFIYLIMMVMMIMITGSSMSASSTPDHDPGSHRPANIYLRGRISCA